MSTGKASGGASGASSARVTSLRSLPEQERRTEQVPDVRRNVAQGRTAAPTARRFGLNSFPRWKGGPCPPSHYPRSMKTLRVFSVEQWKEASPRAIRAALLQARSDTTL